MGDEATIFDERRAEIGQAKTRFAMIVAASCYIGLRWAGLGPEAMPADSAQTILVYFGGFAVYSTLLYLHMRRWPGKYPLRRAAAMVGDYGSLAFTMIVGGEPAMPFYALILWVTVGNGMRFGQRTMILAAILAQLCLVALVAFSPYWRSQPELMITFSIAAMALPTYASLLLKRTSQARDAAMTAMLAKSRFLAQASHDLRQPIHAIGYHIEALRDSPMDDGQLLLVDRIERSLGGVSRLFKSLLDISKLDSGKVEVASEVIALGPFLADLVQQNERFAQWYGVDLRSVPSSLRVRTDPTLLATMLQNLLSNAVKYGDGKGVLVGVRRRGQSATVEIHDQGVGIESGHMADIFDEFVRVQNVGDRDVEGVGLGLSIVRRLAQLCGMRVEMESVRGRGTSVRLAGIPLVSADTPLSTEGRSRFGPLEGMRIVLVEDETDVLVATTQMLEKWGSIVQPWSAKPTGIGPVDAIVADYDLGGGVTGMDVIAAIRMQAGADVPALIMTGHAEERVRENIDQPGILILAKPVQPASLRSTLSTMRIGLITETGSEHASA